MLLHFLRVPLSSPLGTLGFRGSKKVIVVLAWEAALDSRDPNTKLLFFFVTIFSASDDCHLSFLRGDLIWMHTSHSSSGSRVPVPRILLGKQHQFLIEVLVRNCKRGLSSIQLCELLSP